MLSEEQIKAVSAKVSGTVGFLKHAKSFLPKEALQTTKINKIQERALRITYKDAESPYSELLEKDCAVTIHTKNLQLLMTEMYKTKNGLNPTFMEEIFCENATHYNLRNNNEFVQPRVKSVNNGTESVRFKGPQLWQMLPSNDTKFGFALSV